MNVLGLDQPEYQWMLEEAEKDRKKVCVRARLAARASPLPVRLVVRFCTPPPELIRPFRCVFGRMKRESGCKLSEERICSSANWCVRCFGGAS